MALAIVTNGLNTFATLWPAKRRAALIHVTISLAIFLALVYFILFQWYPLPYFHTDGGWQGLRLMFAVDVVLGPLLTFIIFNPAKSRREITFDLSIVALVQVAALSWGVHMVHKERPAAVILWDGGFLTVPAHYYPKEDLSKLSQFDTHTPPVVHERFPTNDETLKSMRMSNEGTPRSAQIFLYQPLSSGLEDAFSRAAVFETNLTAERPKLKGEFARMRVTHGNDVGFVPYKGRFGEAVFVLSRKGEILDSFPRK
jgi:hypothetical protein